MTLLLVLTTSSAAQRDDTAAIIKAYTPLRKHAELFDGRKGWERWIDPPLLEAIRHGQTTGSRSKIDELLRVETPEVYSFQLLSEEFCDAFLEELDNYYSTGLPVHRPNSMNNYGIIVNQIGMKPAITWLQHTVLHPLSQLLFPIQAQGGFDDHHSFMVKYKAGQDLGLDMHTDDSDVTFNICLGRNFTGASLTICGDSRQPQHRMFHKAYEHVRGRALVHLGSRRHGADDIHTGERNNLIVWNQNHKYRNSAEYVNRQPYLPEAAAPDPRCLSYTHDRDFGEFLDYPPGKDEFRGGGWCPPAFACYDTMAPALGGTGRRRKEEL